MGTTLSISLLISSVPRSFKAGGRAGRAIDIQREANLVHQIGPYWQQKLREWSFACRRSGALTCERHLLRENVGNSKHLVPKSFFSTLK